MHEYSSINPQKLIITACNVSLQCVYTLYSDTLYNHIQQAVNYLEQVYNMSHRNVHGLVATAAGKKVTNAINNV